MATRPVWHIGICPGKSTLVVSLIAISLALAGEAQPASSQGRKAPPPDKELIDYRDPPRQYVEARASEWTVFVEKQLQDDNAALAKKAMTRLEKKLGEMLKALPEPSHADLKKVPIYLMYGPKAKGGGRGNGAAYFQKKAPENRKQLDPRWGSCVVIYSAENYAGLTEFWALKVLVHEFAHAHHLEHWPENHPGILRAWEGAMTRGLYKGVKDDKEKIIDKAYASVNQLEYFAELSCMYFVGCNYQPFNRKELAAYDPDGYAMIESLWGLKK